MLAHRVAKIVHPEAALPIGKHRLMIVSPRQYVSLRIAIISQCSHYLNIVHAYYWHQSSIMTIWICQRSARIMRLRHAIFLLLRKCRTADCQTKGCDYLSFDASFHS